MRNFWVFIPEVAHFVFYHGVNFSSNILIQKFDYYLQLYTFTKTTISKYTKST